MMISLTEKRLRDLENRVPAVEVSLRELANKTDVANPCIEQILDLRGKMIAFEQALVSHVSTFSRYQRENDKNLEELNSLLSILAQSIKEKAEQIVDLQSDLKTAHLKIIEIGNIARSLSDVANKHQQVLESHNASISSLDVRGDEIRKGLIDLHSQLNPVRTDASNAFVMIKKMAADFPMLLDQTEKGFLDVNTRLNRSIADIAVKISESKAKAQESKSYDSDIADLHKDMSIVLQTIHSLAGSAPDHIAVNSKIKAMETSIAQIYGLLKKYER